MKNGVYIENGPQDYEIIQQDADGNADLTWSGYWVMEEQIYESAEVYARILLEDSGEEIYTYTPCKCTGDRWTVTLRVPAGGLYKLETGLCLDHCPEKTWNIRGDMRHFFGVGDVFVLAGQSNSAGYGHGVVQDAPVLGVHALKYSDRWQVASHPLGDGTDAVWTESLDGCNLGRSPYLHFGKVLFGRLKYPIGLVQTSLGGSPLSAWNPEEEGNLYRNMLQITANLTNGYKAVIWYQGCTEAQFKEAKGYRERFEEMTNQWRRDSGNPELPFFTAQLNRYIRSTDAEEDWHWGMLREEQRLAAKTIPHCYVLPTSDVPLSDTIHNSAMGCLMIGERFAHQVLYHLYGVGQPFTSASLGQAQMTAPDCIRLQFEGQVDKLETYDAPAGRLELTVKDQQGLVELKSYTVPVDSLVLHLKRRICGPCTVSCGNHSDLTGTVPVDRGTGMPILCFHEVAVCSEEMGL